MMHVNVRKMQLKIHSHSFENLEVSLIIVFKYTLNMSIVCHQFHDFRSCKAIFSLRNTTLSRQL